MIPIDTTTLVEPPKPRKWYQILYVQGNHWVMHLLNWLK